MSDAIHDIRSLPLYEIIGGPLLAIIQAEAKAAQTTLEYIESVGFTDVKKGNAQKAATDIGNLRMASFNYRKLDENGELAEFEVSVPVLSLVPIPAVQVRDAKIEFSVKINDVKIEVADTSMNPQKKKITAKSYAGWLKPKRTELRGALANRARKDDDDKSKIEGTYQLDIAVNIEKADFPVGLTKIFDIMDQAIHDTKAKK